MNLDIQFKKAVGTIKPLNAVNNGPVCKLNTPLDEEYDTNLKWYAEANIPYARTHDAAFYAGYGGNHTVDVNMIFTDFEADPEDPASYDFQLTDEYMQKILMAGTKVYYRLGSKIEHESKKYGAIPPKDFQKWAVICEHIIAHMNEGWADGHHFHIEYWEIWNEPQIPMCWTGTKEQFFDLYEITAKHLKEKFPHIKIGGPGAIGADLAWGREFFERIRERNIPFDFYSWHIYSTTIEETTDLLLKIRNLLDECGLRSTESHLNEWNFVNSNYWGGPVYQASLDTIRAMKGAAYVSGIISACQNLPIDMLMYYDARPCRYNGLFDFFNYTPLKAYHVIKTWGELLRMGTQCAVRCDVPNIYAVASRQVERQIAMITYYDDNSTDHDDAAVSKAFTVTVDDDRVYEVYLLDKTHDMKKVLEAYPHRGELHLTMEPNTVVVLRAK